MGQITLQIPQVGQPDATEDPKIASDFTTIQATIDGQLDATNVTSGFAASATVNQAGQVVKGIVNIPTSQATSSTSYTKLSTHDEVTGIVLSTNGKLIVDYQAQWQESVRGSAGARIFIGTNALKVQGYDGTTRGPLTQTACIGGTVNTLVPLFTFPQGLASVIDTGAYSADVTTGQASGYINAYTGASPPSVTFNLGLQNGVVIPVTPGFAGGPCVIENVAAGTYTVSVQFAVVTGTVTVQNRRLSVEARSYA